MVLDGPGCKLVRCEPLEARVGAVLVEVVLPLRQQGAHVCQRAEWSLVQQLVAQPAIERLHERVLNRLTRLDVVPGNVLLLLPAQHRQRRELRAIVADDGLRLPARRFRTYSPT